ncbi:MAG: hypothetical protein JKY02_01685 [Flavobacteriaceae bacterium]|nr:hypothetical protein [Flavobacteriaceae bacterium]
MPISSDKTKEQPRIEQIIRLHYELEINMEGIEVIKYILNTTN